MTDQYFDAGISQLLESFNRNNQDTSNEYASCQADSCLDNALLQTMDHAWLDFCATYDPNGDGMTDRNTPQDSMHSVTRSSGDSPASSGNEPSISTPIEEPAVVESVPGPHERLQDSLKELDKEIGRAQEWGEVRTATKEIQRLSAMLLKEQKKTRKTAGELSKATRHITILQGRLNDVRMKSRREAEELRKILRETIREQREARRMFVGMIREKNRSSAETACRHAEVQNEVTVLKGTIETWKMLRGVSVEDRARLLNARTTMLEARNRDSQLQFERIRRRVEEMDDEWEALLIEKEPKEDVVEKEVLDSC